MSNNDFLEQQIEAFLGGKMNAEEQAVFKKALSENQELVKVLALRQLEFEVAENIIAQDIRQQLQALKASQPIPSAASIWKKIYMRLLLLAVLLVLLGGLLHWYFKRPLPTPTNTIPPLESPPQKELPTPELLPESPNKAAPTPQNNPKETPRQQEADPIALSKFWYTEPDFSTLRSLSPQSTDAYGEALDAWQEKDFKKVRLLLENHSKDDPNIFRVRMLLAHAHYQLGDFQRAYRLFASIADSQLMPWAEEAQWYAILALLALGETENSDFQKKLQSISTTKNHPYFDQAKQLKASLSD
ncbi:MAG TPA: hypothetical protein PKA00_15700 [Saprospiraceae bacterium]|mgnify:CR=1 FL=1|nr:hypothetical protein [Saprospiraceae bacterium]HMQ84358.1 hypothetical protein [Saprospiraceae bacterium]